MHKTTNPVLIIMADLGMPRSRLLSIPVFLPINKNILGISLLALTYWNTKKDLVLNHLHSHELISEPLHLVAFLAKLFVLATESN